MWNLLYLAAEKVTVNKIAFSCKNNSLFTFEEVLIQIKEVVTFEINKSLRFFHAMLHAWIWDSISTSRTCLSCRKQFVSDNS